MQTPLESTGFWHSCPAHPTPPAPPPPRPRRRAKFEKKKLKERNVNFRAPAPASRGFGLHAALSARALSARLFPMPSALRRKRPGHPG